MNREEVHTTLRFVGDWPWWAGAGLAALLGAVAWWLYHREVGGLGWALRWSLPALRGGAVAMITLMLAGPILHHRRIIGELSQLFIFVDASRSMDRPDPSMPLGRKILVLQRLGLLPPGTVNMELSQAAEAMAEAKAGAERAQGVPGTDTAGWDQMVRDLLAQIREAQKRVAQTGEPARAERLGKEVVDPAVALAGRELKQGDDRQRAVEDLARLGERSGRWQRELETAFEKEVGAQAATEGSALKAALDLFGNLPRAQRLQSMLLEGPQEKLLATLARTHDVQLLALNTAGAQKIWQPTQRDSNLPAEFPKPTGENTNLAAGLKALSTSNRTRNTRGAVVLLSDGQHNTGESPVEVAKILGGRQLPIFPVGFGSQVRPEDLAILSIDGPGAVFYQDRIRGQVTLKDDMPAGQPFTLVIKTGEKVVWEQKFLTESKPQRKVPFDFALQEIVQARLQDRQSQDVQVSGFPLDFQVSVSSLDADREPGNNAGSLRVRALTQKRKILILEGRPRWEIRYLRNLFERDEQWDVNAVIAGTSAGEAGFVRGREPGQFPGDPALLQPYDLIVFGEVPRAVFRNEELEWIKKFVAERGGALIFIDGARGRFKEYGDTAIGPMFPVVWKGGEIRGGIERLVLNERGQQSAPFALAPDRAQNAEVWRALLPPHWLSGAEPLPGAETLLEAEVQGQRKAAVVYRPFGAGRVLYQAFDDSWRWRHEVADRYHVKYWNQVASWVAELPFAVHDKFISLDAGAITYQPGDSADLRVRLRDGEGRPVTNASVDAVLFRDGRKAANIRLAADENAGGLFRGRTAALEPGNYEVAVQSVAIAERDSRARTEFKVAPRETGELSTLSLNEDLLRQMADYSGGQYLREEHIDKLAALLAPISQGKVIETDTVLWQSYWWFLPLISLLTAEWIIRKRVGLL